LLRPIAPRAASAVPVHAHSCAHGEHHDHAHGPLAAVHDAGVAPERIVQVERDLLAANDAIATRNRTRLARHGVLALNFVSSPGSGKTTLLVRTIERLRASLAVSVIEGDQQTSRDADRIRATGAPAIQINTGKGCHLDARMIEEALQRLPLPDRGALFIENVGNLVCPAAFDLGEAHKVVILSVTEGDDKPLKYPDMFRAADVLLVSKIDLLPYVPFDVDAAIANARRMRPGIDVMRVSATSGEGMAAWVAWLDARAAQCAARGAAPGVAAGADRRLR
jgi:hydrogenase nickel incorporation protein HypB